MRVSCITYAHSFILLILSSLHIICIHFYVQVNTNGVISIDSLFTSYSPSPLPLSGSDKIIAPYWGDVDTRGTGQIFYRQTTNTSLLDRVSRQLQTTFPLSLNVTITNLFIATWDAVGYYDMQTDKVNQLYHVVL